jgi:hypothetical protein
MILSDYIPLSNGQSTVVGVTFSRPFSEVPVVVPAVINTVDGSPLAITAQISTLSTTSFSLRLSAATNSANYGIHWIASDGTGAGQVYGQFFQQLPAQAALPSDLASLPLALPDAFGTTRMPISLLRQLFPNKTGGVTGPGDPGSTLALALSADEQYLLVRTSTKWVRLAAVGDIDWTSDYAVRPKRVGVVPLDDGALSKAVTFSPAFAGGAPPLVRCQVLNYGNDSLKAITYAMPTAASLSGFTVQFQGPVVGDDYQLWYEAEQF